MGLIRGLFLTGAGVTVGLVAAMGMTGSDSSGGAAGAAPVTPPPTPAATAPAPVDCVAPEGQAGPRLDADQRANAKAIVDAATRAKVGDAGARIGIAAALVEGQYTRGEKGGPVRGLRNVPYGHASSVGIFQELAGAGSGFQLTTAQRMDVASAADRFFTKLKRVPGWQRMDPGAAAQAVQRSAFPTRYAQRISEATQIVAATGGGQACTPIAAPVGAPANVAAAVAWATSKNGKPYIWGGTGPDGWDCSGLMLRAFEKVGVELPRTAEMQRAWCADGHCTRIQPGQEKPGDLIFSLRGGRAYHVVMVQDTARKRSIEALQTCRSSHKGAGIDCGVGHFDYHRRINNGGPIWRVNQ